MHKILPFLLPVLGLLLPPSAPAQTLRGSKTSVERIYRQAQSHDLYFYESSDGVRRAAQRGDFVRLRPNGNFELAGVSHPYLLPQTHTFVVRLAAQYRAACGEKLVVTSAVRPQSLRLANSVDKSVHPTGMAVDLRKPTQARCLSWLRETLLTLEARGVLEAVEERRPPHFHVAVFPTPYRRYLAAGGGAAFTESDGGAGAGSTGSRTYRVRPGDSLWTIARRNKVSVEQIKSANSLRSSQIREGQVLVIPQGR